MKRGSLTLMVPLILLAAIVTMPITVIEDAFARNGNGRHTGDLSQATSVSNSCLNPVSNSNTNDNMISNGNCGGTVSQQGRSGQASSPTTVQNANPTIEVQRSTTTPTTQPPTTPNPGPNAGPLDTNIVHLQIIPNDEIGIVGNVTITDTATQKSNSYPFFGPGPGGDIFDEFVIPVGDKFLVNANVIGNGPNSLLTPDPASTIACNSTGPATCVATMINNNPHLILDVGTTD